MFLEKLSTRNCKHVINALLRYRQKHLTDELATGIEQKQFDEVVDEFIKAHGGAQYDEKRAKEKAQSVKPEKAPIEDEIPF